MNRYMPCLSVIEGSIYIFYSKYYNEAIQATQSSIYIYIYLYEYVHTILMMCLYVRMSACVHACVA